MDQKHGASVALLSVGLVLGWTHSTAPRSAAPRASIEARAVDPSGQPISGVFVTAMLAIGGDSRTATTDRSGTARLDNLLDGKYRLDFDIAGFDIERRHVIVGRDASAQVSAILRVTPKCECVRISPTGAGPEPVLAQRPGQVLDDAGHPLPHARLELVPPATQEFTDADRNGRFVVSLPVDSSGPLRASDSGFRTITQQVAGNTHDALVFHLPVEGTVVGWRDAERLSPGCCPSDFFHQPR